MTVDMSAGGYFQYPIRIRPVAIPNIDVDATGVCMSMGIYWSSTTILYSYP
jgi:hypothetical protein